MQLRLGLRTPNPDLWLITADRRWWVGIAISPGGGGYPRIIIHQGTSTDIHLLNGGGDSESLISRSNLTLSLPHPHNLTICSLPTQINPCLTFPGSPPHSRGVASSPSLGEVVTSPRSLAHSFAFPRRRRCKPLFTASRNLIAARSSRAHSRCCRHHARYATLLHVSVCLSRHRH
ncbi:hypothetical protein PIB30_090954 [Stylosanthes scabra]|uniref:Uncharacterized protein n=1 Tax=Stylosanthes scabra TaxID=79078 RepID=A0ABU6TV00_9FABA|nr:hypothetical protein [Stylosanthes scabra]